MTEWAKDVHGRNAYPLAPATDQGADDALIDRVDALIDRMDELLDGVVVALHGPHPEAGRNSYHDLPERAAAVVAERDDLREFLNEARSGWESSAEACRELDAGLRVATEERDTLREQLAEARRESQKLSAMLDHQREESDDAERMLREALSAARREAAEAQAIAAKFSPLFQCIGYHGSDVELQRDLQAVRTSSHDNPGSALQSAIEQAVAPHREQVRVLVEALELALSSHGVLLMSDPPQDAWKFRGVDAKLCAALATVKQEGEKV
jgi:hypothetical protein